MLVLLWVAIGGAGLAALGTLWATARQHEDEAQLLFIGHQYRQAIARYYQRGSGMNNRYPPSIEELLKDSRNPGIERHLRRPWADPVTGEPWELIPAPGGGIMGVRSSSSKRPLKLTNFDAVNAAFENLGQLRGADVTYADWEFVYLPPGAAAGNRGAPR
jgi:hypothetical protein